MFLLFILLFALALVYVTMFCLIYPNSVEAYLINIMYVFGIYFFVAKTLNLLMVTFLFYVMKKASFMK